MQNLTKKIHQYINTDRCEKKYRVLALILSFIVAFSVFGSLIMPAISMTKSGVILSAATTTMPGDFSWDNLNSYVDLNGKIVTENGTPVVFPDENQGDLTNNPDAVKATIQFQYKLDPGTVSSSSSKYVYLELDENVKLAEGREFHGNVTDASYPNAPSGDYYLTTHDGTTYLVIKFTDDYLTHCGTNGVQAGSVSFSAVIERGEDQNGEESSITIGNANNVKVPGFTNKVLNFGKDGTANGDGTITWTVTVENQEGKDLSGYKLSDSMMSGADVTINPANVGQMVDGTFVFNKNTENMKEPITFTYTTKLTDEQTYTPNNAVKNTAKLTDTDGTEKTADKEVYYDLGYNVSEKSYSSSSDGMTWTIKVDNTYKRSLTGFKIKDEAFRDLKEGTTITLTEGVTGTVEGNILTIEDNRSEGNYGDLEITYTTAPEEGLENQTNKAELIPPNSDNPISNKETYWDTKFVYISKNDVNNDNDIDKDNKTITWHINVNGKKWVDGKEINNPINGYTVTDEMLKNIIPDSLIIKKMYSSDTISKDLYAYDANSGTITFGNDIDVSQVEIEYKISYDSTSDDYLPPYSIDKSNGETSMVYKNTAYLGHNGVEVGKTDEKTATVAPTNDVTKTKQSVTENKDEDGRVTSLTVDWCVDLKQEMGALKNWTLTDSDMQACLKDTSNWSVIADLPHTISEEQLSALWIEGSKGDWNYQTLTNSKVNTYYTVTPRADGGFTLQFTENCDEYDKVKIYFKSTVDLSAVESGRVEYSNKVSYHGKDSTPTDSYDLKKPIDTSKTPYEKYNVSDGAENNGDNAVKINKNALPKVTVDGIEYYLFKYKIVFNKDNTHSDKLTIVDTLPDGFKLYSEVLDENNEPDASNSGKVKIYRYAHNDWVYLPIVNWEQNYSVYVENNTLRFYLDYYDGKQADIYYNLIVPVSTLDENLKNGEFTFTNTIQEINATYEPATNTTTVINTGKPVITKTGRNLFSPGSYEYVVDINPDGKNLTANNRKLTITDIMQSCEPYNGIGNGSAAFLADLTSIQLYEVNSDGTRGDTVDCNIDTDLNPSNTVVTYPTFTSDGNSTWTCEQSFPVGSTAVIKFKAPNNYNSDETFSFKIMKKESWGWSDFTTLNKCSYSDGYYEYTLNITDDFKDGIKLESWRDNWSELPIIPTDVTMALTEVQTPYVAKIVASDVPDGKHLQLVYTYNCWRDTSALDDSCGITNSASLTIPGDTVLTDGDKIAVSKDTITLKDKSSATSETAKSFALEKVAVGHNNLLLTAGFELYRYHDNNGDGNYVWQAAQSITENASSHVNDVSWSTNETGAGEIITDSEQKLKINLESGVLYKLVEVSEPNVTGEEYIKLEEPVYFCYVSDPEHLPDGITSGKYKKVLSNNSILVKNAKYIDVSVTKNWVGASWEDFESVTVQFYRSLKEYTDGFPAEGEYELIGKNSDGNFVADDGSGLQTEFEITSSDKFTFKDLPNGNEQGEKYYYYVKEIAITDKDGTKKSIEDSLFKPKYSAHAMSVEDSEVTITNSSTLVVSKVWKDQNNDAIENPPVSEVTFDLYSSTVQMSNSYPNDSQLTLVKEGITVSAENDWSVSVTGEDGKPLPDKDDDGNPLYYYVKEHNITGYEVSYWPSNGTTADGTAVMTNTFKPETMSMKLSKIWSDSDEKTHADDILTFNIYRTTDPTKVPTNINTFAGSTGGNSGGGSSGTINETVLYSGETSIIIPDTSKENDGKWNTVVGVSTTNSGGTVSPSIITEGGYFYVEYGGTQNQLELILQAWQNADRWAKVPIGESGVLENGHFYAKYPYASCVSAFTDSDFDAKLDNVIVGTIEQSLTVYKLSYVSVTSGGSTEPETPLELTKSDNPYHGSVIDETYYTSVELKALDSWSKDIELEKTDNVGHLYYYWIEETTLGQAAMDSTKYTAYYRYNGTDGSFSFDGTTENPTVEVYNSNETNTGSLPETGGTGTTPYKVVGAAISCTAAVLLVTKRRKVMQNKK